MMTITLNGSQKKMPDDFTVSKMLELFGYKKSKAAVWIDGVQLLFSEYDTRIVAEGSNVKVLRILGGG